MKRTLIILIFFLLGVSESCMGQIVASKAMDIMLSNRVKELDKQIELLNAQLKNLIVQRDAAQKEIDRLDKIMEEASVNAPNFLVDPPVVRKSSTSVTPTIKIDSSGKSNTNDLDRDKRIVKNYISQGNSIAAYNYIKEEFKENYPADSNEQFGYTTLLQDIITGLTNDGNKAINSLDFATGLSITCYLSGADQLHIELLAKAAANGHTEANKILQLKAAMYGGSGGNVSIPYNSNSGSSSSSSQKTCTLCNGKGWIAGSKTPTYGNTGAHWCSECARNVNALHSHDTCPSCSGRGYR